MHSKKSLLSLLLFTCYPSLVLLNLLLSLSDTHLVILTLLFFFLFVNFLVFKTESRLFWWNTLERVLVFSGISILFSYALVASKFPLLHSLSSTKTGLVLGLLTSLLLTHHIARHCDPIRDTKHYFLPAQKDDQESWLPANTMIWLLAITVFVAASIFGIFGEMLFKGFDKSNGLITFFSILSLTIGLLIFKNKRVKFKMDKSNKHLLLGLLLTLIGVYLTIRYEGSVGYWGMLLSLLGLWLTQPQSVKASASFDNVLEFKRAFMLPSLTIWCLSIVIWYFDDGQFRELTQPNYQLEAKQALEHRSNKLEKRLVAMFDTLEAAGKLKKGYAPNVSLSLTPDRDWLLQSRLHLEAVFSYDYAQEHLDTLANYTLGKYSLEHSNIAQAIVNGFQLAIDNYLANYFERGNEVDIVIEGTSDATPFRPSSRNVYEGEYGDLKNLVALNRYDQKNKNFTILTGEKLNNENLALLRGIGIRGFIRSSVERLKRAQATYHLEYFAYEKNIGGMHRRISIRLKIKNLNPNLLN